MHIEASSGPEFESTIYLRGTVASLLRQCKQQRAPEVTRPKVPEGYVATGTVQKQSIICQCCKLTSKHDGRDFMLISTIAALLLSCEVGKCRFF